MIHAIFGRVFTVKTLIRAGLTALSLSSIAVAHSEPRQYQAPAHNFYQNNWMGS
jgi:hypothetical protein